MRGLVIRNIIRFVALLAIQVLVLNNIYLGGYISPVLYTLFILMLPNRIGKMYMLLLAFVMGLSVDVCSNMLGFHACASTIMAFCRITFADRIITRGDDISIEMPSIFTVVPQYFVFYSATLIFIHTFVFFMLDYFNLADILNIILSALLTTIVTLVLVIVWQLIFIHRKRAK